ncbi:MAG: PepSY domain-containing protein [Pseudomonadota bacterium]
MNKLVGAIILSVSLVPHIAVADKRPPENSLPLSDVIRMLEEKGYYPVTEVDIDDGLWEVEAFKGTEARELKVDPKTGAIVSDKPDD